MLSHASSTIGLVPTAVTAPVITRLGNENTATGPVGVISILVLTEEPAGPTEGGGVSVEVLNSPLAMTYGTVPFVQTTLGELMFHGQSFVLMGLGTKMFKS